MYEIEEMDEGELISKCIYKITECVSEVAQVVYVWRVYKRVERVSGED